MTIAQHADIILTLQLETVFKKIQKMFIFEPSKYIFEWMPLGKKELE
jgi:hypothetical protein